MTMKSPALVILITFVASLAVATGRQKTFKVMKISSDAMCILDNPSRSLRVGKLQCSFECTTSNQCDNFNVIDQVAVASGETATCQLFDNRPSFLGKLQGCTAFENTASICQSIAPANSEAMTLSPPYCCNVLFSGALETTCLSTVQTGKGCQSLTSDKSATCSPTTRATFTSPTSGFIVPGLSIGSRILLQNKVAYGTGIVSFNQGWTSYADGFGQPSLTDNYWIGNEKMYALTSGSTKYRLRFEIKRTDGYWTYAEYDWFTVESSSTSYRLTVSVAYSGNAGDAIFDTYDGWKSNGKSFGTFDRDSNSCGPYNCASDKNSGWWWACCTASAVNADGNVSWVTNSNGTRDDVIASRMYAQQN